MVLFIVILALLAAGVVAWASERVLGKDAPRLVSVLAFAAGLVWSAALWLDGSASTSPWRWTA